MHNRSSLRLLLADCLLRCTRTHRHLQVCAALGIPLYEADFVSQYWTSVFAAFLEGLEQGLTPNPDLACNSHIKFGALLQFAKQKGADVLATGHYARLAWRTAENAASAAAGCGTVQQQQQQQQLKPVLLAGADPLKDQTYFLAGLNQQQLASAMFPVGEGNEVYQQCNGGSCCIMFSNCVSCNL
jgi:tRNA-specific 2-thiouridylase